MITLCSCHTIRPIWSFWEVISPLEQCLSKREKPSMVRVQLHGLHMDWVGREKGSGLRASTGDCSGVKSLAMLGRIG